MTMPDEELWALQRTNKFFEWIAMEYNSKTKVSEVRERARACWRHYPWDTTLAEMWKPRIDANPLASKGHNYGPVFQDIEENEVKEE